MIALENSCGGRYYVDDETAEKIRKLLWQTDGNQR